MAVVTVPRVRGTRVTVTPRGAVVWLCAIAVTAAGALAISVLPRAATGERAVVTLAANLRQGERITAADLRVTEIRGGSAASGLPAAAASGLIGQYAITVLAAGSVLTQADVSARHIPVPAMAPAAAPAAAAAAARLVPGDQVTVVAPGRHPVSAIVFGVSRKAVQLLVPPGYPSAGITVRP